MVSKKELKLSLQATRAEFKAYRMEYGFTCLKEANLQDEIARLTEIIYDYREIVGEYNAENRRPCLVSSCPEMISKGIRSPRGR